MERLCASARYAGLEDGSRIAVIARRPIGLGGIRARARRRIAAARGLALVLGGARDGIGACARARLAGVGLGARVAVVASRAVALRGIRASARSRIAAAGGVTLIGRDARDRVGADA